MKHTLIIDTEFTDLEIELMHIFAGELIMDSPENEIDNGNMCFLINQDIEKITGGMSVARGVVSSLIKKGFISAEMADDPADWYSNKQRAEYWAFDEFLPYLFALKEK